MPMVETWLALLGGGILLLVGFAAALAFRRFHVPDFMLLIFLGAALSFIPVAPFGPGFLASLEPLVPLLTQLTIAFILFEGGLSLRLRESGRSLPALVAHAVGAMAATAVLLWFVATDLLGLGNVTALVLALAFSGPSASIALSFAPHMRLDPRAETAIVLEGILTNVIAVIGVLFVLQWFGSLAGRELVPYLVQLGEALAMALAAGYGWGRVVNRLAEQPFVHVASLALAISVYAAAQGFMGQTGALSVFVFGVVVGHERAAATTPGRRATAPESLPPDARLLRELGEFVDGTVVADAPLREAPRSGWTLRQFQSEVTFALRTFFFVYLGLLLVSEWGGLPAFRVGLVVVGAFLAGRLPTSLALGRGLRLSARDTRAVFASAARGLTDVVLLLFAKQSGALPNSEVQPLLTIMPTVVLISAFASAILVTWAARSPGLVRAAPKEGRAAAPAGGKGA